MHDVISKIKDVAKQDIEKLAAKGYDHIDRDCFGKAVDALKDAMQMEYFEAEKMKACIESKYMLDIKFPNKMLEMELNERMLQEMDEPDYGMGRMGYDRWRYANGRFAPKGRGHETRVRSRRGYTPDYRMYPGMEYEDMYDDFPGMPDEIYGDYRMGYSGGRGGNSGGSYGGNRGGSGSGGSYGDGRSSNGRYGYKEMQKPSKYGESYDRYRENKRYFTESKDPEHQKMMKESMEHVFDDMEDIVKDMWSDADSTDKQKFKQKLTQIVQKMQ